MNRIIRFDDRRRLAASRRSRSLWFGNFLPWPICIGGFKTASAIAMCCATSHREQLAQRSRRGWMRITNRGISDFVRRIFVHTYLQGRAAFALRVPVTEG
jgi:hypothetical protein